MLAKWSFLRAVLLPRSHPHHMALLPSSRSHPNVALLPHASPCPQHVALLLRPHVHRHLPDPCTLAGRSSCASTFTP